MFGAKIQSKNVRPKKFEKYNVKNNLQNKKMSVQKYYP